jgi:hypothetical protein
MTRTAQKMAPGNNSRRSSSVQAIADAVGQSPF